MFSTYEKMDGTKKVYMGNVAASNVEGKGKVLLKWTSRKILTLTNVWHVPKIHNNLVFGTRLNKNRFKLIFKSDKFTLTKGGMYVDHGYLDDGMFKLNVQAQVPKKKNKNDSSTYTVESCDVWHSILKHVNYRSLQRMVNL